jgi:hypothetical protein
MGNREWGFWQIIIFILALCIALAGLITHESALQDTNTSSIEKPIVKTDDISVASSPNGSDIYREDSYKVESPNILENVNQSSNIVTFKIERAENYSKTTSTVTTGNISVASSPNGASIYLDDTYKGETPKNVENVEQGSHVLALKLTGYNYWSQHISVDPDKTLSLSPVLISNDTSQVESHDMSQVDNEHMPSVKIENIWSENGVWNGGLKGVRIHTAFDTYNLKDKECLVAALFYNNLDGTQLKDNDGFYAVDGKVAVYDYFTPDYVNTSYSDFTLFIPYDELHMNLGTAYIRFKVAIFDGDNILDISNWNDFSFIQY